MSIAPPVVRECWSYAGEFNVEASGHNRHRRATLPELKAHFDTSENRPAHWYEAQLLHYGLPPSKTKGTAKMRLFESVSKGHLAVPGHIAKIEADLRKEWIKREREAKQALKKQSEPAAPKASKKRKADDGPQPGTNINISLNLAVGAGGNVSFSSASPAPAAKKAKTVKTEPAAPKPKAPAKAKAPTTKPTPTSYSWTPSKDAAPVFTGALPKPQPTSTSYSWTPKRESSPVFGAAPASAPRTKQTARRSRGWLPTSSARQPPSSPPEPTPRKQTARRGGPLASASCPLEASARRGGRLHSAGVAHTPQFFNGPPQPEFGFDDPPPPYPGSQEDDLPHSLPPLGLLNGRYAIDITDWNQMDSGLVLTLDGNALWGSFDVGGFFRGIIRLNERPYQSSYDMFFFDWRGENDSTGYRRFGDEEPDGSYIRFLGDGRIEGMIGDGEGLVRFDGERLSGQETRSEISAWNMRRQWVEGPDVNGRG
ncbi:hypothetical protein QBC39DRAFT_359930 [Podospora conica]|nr:hypothetical protein QBC39DRAFT_359930 [Schizothecium conicum]